MTHKSTALSVAQYVCQCSAQLLYKHGISANAGQIHELYLSAHGHLYVPKILRY